MRRLFTRPFAVIYAVTIVTGCSVSIGLTNSPTIPNSVPDPLKKN